MCNLWRDVLEERYPNIPVYELILVHQVTQLLFFPILFLAYKSRMSDTAKKTSFIRLGPCYDFIHEIKLQNPYVPNIYLLDPQGRACWVSSSAPTEKDLKQLQQYFSTRKPKSSPKENKE